MFQRSSAPSAIDPSAVAPHMKPIIKLLNRINWKPLDSISVHSASGIVNLGTVPVRDMSAGWFGKCRPVVPNTQADGSGDPEGRQRNRRVEIVVAPRP